MLRTYLTVNISNILLYFVRSGRLNLIVTAGAFGYAGFHGYWWSSRGSSTRYDGVTIPSAYNLVFYASTVYPSGGPSNRYNAFPLRYLSTVLGM